ncbi:Flp pilus assembly protein CpaB [Pseudomonas sp. MM211]|uniref:Flp pilus assembly protein CpaB n=1 Tax=Pseudomonas sp. MM211 TaxID=2866808 RepID=UPI001CECE439|nr:Flp pilus assembly protein CpaB [Pseudomonas sp. MM211]UCJ16334.1 Flp pilus assembly protein CpaB [Pseudomonas sp. MM211]
MKTPSVLLLAGTLLVAGSAALLARVLLAPPPPVVAAAPIVEEPKPTHPAILVAARDLRPGDFIDASAVEWQASDSAHDERLYYTRNQADLTHLTGASVRRSVAAGVPLTSALVVKSNEPGFIATVITPGMRAITVPTDQTASQYSMLTSGDRVDVVVNLQRETEQDTGSVQSSDLATMFGADLPNRTDEQRQRMVNQVLSIQAQNQVPRLASQTLLQNVRVLSINNLVRSPLQPRPEDEPNAKKNPDAYPRSAPQTVTLEVPPAYAERLALASQIGTLQLALRSSQEVGDGQVRPGNGRVTTLAQTTGVYSASAPFANQRPLVKTFHGDTSNVVQFDYQ